jgi:hypothetical protein
VDLSETYNGGPDSSFKAEIVIPRCCEQGNEISWIIPLLSSTSVITISIYYKCPSCLPKSFASEWLPNIYNDPYLMVRKTGGVIILDDSEFLNYKTRIRQFPCFDTIYNGKEVTAYLSHIVNNYNSLANQTIFFHSVPNAHLYLKLFYRLVQYLEICRHHVSFLHLNANYKSDLWGNCCGKKGLCQSSTWNYLFHSKSQEDRYLRLPTPGEIGTYSSAQFSASRDAIYSRPKEFWMKMLLAINGSYDITGCPTNSEPGKEFGGHQLTGQYERFWHIIFGHEYRQIYRSSDPLIPAYLRIDCSSDVCTGAV